MERKTLAGVGADAAPMAITGSGVGSHDSGTDPTLT